MNWYNRCVIVLFGLIGFATNAQNKTIDSLFVTYEDQKYFEDQIYAGMVYNVLLGKPSGLTQNNFSNGFIVGFIKDIPVNKARNIGLGVGLGYTNNSFYYNVRAVKTARGITYNYIDGDVYYKRSKIETHGIEMPIEFRWRTSTTTSTKFWRIYTGLRIAYVFSGISKYIDGDVKDIFTNGDIEPLQLNTYLSVGYNTWNLYGSFSLTKIFKNGTVMESNGEALDMGYLNAGLIFYLL